jgi:diguanylate cyclase (GGDEF)-like protein/PAS domain S-box-containing protein
MYRVAWCITQEHDLRLVALAAGICVVACFTTLNLLNRVQTVERESSWAWLIAAAVVFGCGVWSLHFVAMLAFLPGVEIAYDVKTTVVSLVVANVGALLALLFWRLAASRLIAIVGGGALLAGTVSCMHYCGIAAMRVAGGLRFDHQEVTASVVVGIVFGILAMARSETLTSFRRRAEVSLWLTLCICGVHFVGMTALSIDFDHPADYSGAVIGSGWLAVTVGSVSMAILLVSLAATLMDQHLTQRTVLELKRMRLLSDASREVIVIHRDGVVRQVNAAGARLFGVPVEQLIGRPWLELIAEGDHRLVTRRAGRQNKELTPEELHVRTPAGRLIPVELASSAISYEGKPAVAVSLRDLSQRKRDEARIRHLAHHDALTDLPNRFLLQDRLNAALHAATRSKAIVAVLYLDLDRFKPVNDLLGHAMGDALLIQVGQRLRAALRANDDLARIGGDEFMVVTTVEAPESVALLAGRLVDTMSEPFDLGRDQVEIGVSIGIALFPRDSDSEEGLMHAADTALYRAKEEKRGTFRFFEAAMDEQLHARRQLEHDLRHAVENNQLELHYQPLVNCVSGKVEGFEALLRWHHPKHGMMRPGEFIPLAEETGLIIKIGQWVIETACEAAAKWIEPHRLAVNISPIQFRKSDLVQIVSDALASAGLPGERLEIEITEGILMEDTERAIEVLSALREQGVRIALDDFGTGYSSLSYLRSFTLDKLKIDRSFIKELGQSPESEIIVRTIIGLAHNLGLSIVAEGVETPQQLSILRDLTCDQLQGYLFGRPKRMDMDVLPVGDPQSLDS